MCSISIAVGEKMKNISTKIKLMLFPVLFVITVLYQDMCIYIIAIM